MEKTLSIIIPSFNQGKYIEETLRSATTQMTDEIEIIVMDGGSSDNSVEIIKKYSDRIAYWQSQKDRGQSDAINQGFKKASGTFVTWLNSDDILLPGSLAKCLKMFRKYPQCDFFLGNVMWMDKNGHIIQAHRVENENSFWNRHHLFSNGGPSAFIRTSVLNEIGYLREDFHYMMDTELWHRLITTGHPFKRIRSFIWGLRLHEEAKMSGHNFKESKLADHNHPSWIQKKKESGFIDKNYFPSQSWRKIWRASRFIGFLPLTRIIDRKWLGKHYSAF